MRPTAEARGPRGGAGVVVAYVKPSRGAATTAAGMQRSAEQVGDTITNSDNVSENKKFTAETAETAE